MAAEQKKCYLFVGNPGTGKSTILNGIIGEPKFVSKTSKDGAGVTYQLDKKEISGIVYMDTPGLSDEKLRNEAAEAITEALKQDGFYRIFFVVTVEAGRVRPDDKTTIKLILEASPDITDYSVIINKATKKWVKDIMKPEVLEPWTACLMGGLPTISGSIHFMSRDDDLEDEDNVKYNAPDDVVQFVRGAPGMRIKSTSVKDVKASEFEQMREENAKLQRQLEQSKELQKQEMDRMKKKFEITNKKAEEAQKQMKDAQEISNRMQTKIEETERENKRKFEDMEKQKAEFENRAKKQREDDQRDREEDTKKYEQDKKKFDQDLQASKAAGEKAMEEAKKAAADADKKAREAIEAAQQQNRNNDNDNNFFGMIGNGLGKILGL